MSNKINSKQFDHLPPCPFCHSHDISTTIIDRYWRGDRFRTVIACSQCGCYSIYPFFTLGGLPVTKRDEDSQRDYSKKNVESLVYGASLWRGYRDKRIKKSWKLNLMSWFLRDQIERLPEQQYLGKILEIGCTSGAYLELLNNLGFMVSGVTASAEMVKDIISSCRGNILVANFPPTDFADGSFDVVVLWDVIPALENPQPWLMECYRLLRVGGLLMLENPDAFAFEARLFKSSWSGWELKRNCIYFPRNTLGDYLLDLGFIDVKLKTISTHRPFIRSLGYAEDKIIRSRSWNFPGWLKRFNQILGTGLFLLSRMISGGSSYLVMAIKPEK